MVIQNLGYQLYSMARSTLRDSVIPGVSRNLLNREKVRISEKIPERSLSRIHYGSRNDSL
jgi:hypothetical protein